MAGNENPHAQGSLGSPFPQGALKSDSTGKPLEDVDIERSGRVISVFDPRRVAVGIRTHVAVHLGKAFGIVRDKGIKIRSLQYDMELLQRFCSPPACLL